MSRVIKWMGVTTQRARAAISPVTFNIRTICAMLFFALLIILPMMDRFSYITNVLSQSVVLATMALGQTFVIISGGIDLSVGSVGGLAGMYAAGFITNGGISPGVAIVLAILIGAGIGVVNGVLIHTFKIAPFVATLSTLAIGRGITLVYTAGTPISVSTPQFTALASGTWGGISPAIILVLLLYILGYLVLKYTPYGLHVHAIGNNARGARLSGVAVGRVTITTYALCSACAALGGIILASRLWSAQPNAAVGFELDVIAVVVLGGASLFGGIGTLQGTLTGVLLLGFLSNGMNLMKIPSYGQRVVWGTILIIVVGIDIRIRATRQKKRDG